MKRLNRNLIALMLFGFFVTAATSSYALSSSGSRVCISYVHDNHAKTHKAGTPVLAVDLTPKKNHYGKLIHYTPEKRFTQLKKYDTVTYKNERFEVVYIKPVKDGYMVMLKLKK